MQNWFRLDTRPLRDPAAIGAALADLTVGGLLRRPGRRSPTVADRAGAVELT